MWKDVVGFEDSYEVSNIGNIKSKEKSVRCKGGGLRIKPMMYLRKQNTYRGYKSVFLSKDNRKRTKMVHRLVVIAFIENPLAKPQVNHINGIKTDNRLVNLEWCTNGENIKHAYKTGLIKTRYGKFHWNSIIVIDNSTNVEYDSMSIAAKSINMSIGCLARMLNGKRKNKTNMILKLSLPI